MPGQPRAVAFPSRLLAPLVFSSSQGEGMKVQFEFTPADLAEVGRRAVNRSPMVHRWRLMNSLSVAILVGLLVLVATPWELAIRSIVGAAVAVVLFVVVFYLSRRQGA